MHFGGTIRICALGNTRIDSRVTLADLLGLDQLSLLCWRRRRTPLTLSLLLLGRVKEWARPGEPTRTGCSLGKAFRCYLLRLSSSRRPPPYPRARRARQKVLPRSSQGRRIWSLFCIRGRAGQALWPITCLEVSSQSRWARRMERVKGRREKGQTEWVLSDRKHCLPPAWGYWRRRTRR
jgi:hypothetical protein